MTRVGGGRHSTLGFWSFTNTSSASPKGLVYRSPLSSGT